MDLFNSIVAKFGERIEWPYPRQAILILNDGGNVYVWFRGNKYADYLELCCSKPEVLNGIKQSFPDDFKGEVFIKNGSLE
jgi:hypothetical protein